MDDSRSGTRKQVEPDRHRELHDAVEQSMASREILSRSGRWTPTPTPFSTRSWSEPLASATQTRPSSPRGRRADSALPLHEHRLGGVSGLRRESPPCPEQDIVGGACRRGPPTQQIADVLADPEYQRLDLQRIGGYRTLLSSPMILDEEVVGVFSIWRMEVSPFDEDEIRRLDELGIQGAIALRQVRLLRALEARTSELATKIVQMEALREVGEVVSSSLDLEEVLQTIVENAVRLTSTDGGSIMEYVEQDRAFSVRATYGSSQQLIDRLREITIARDSTLVGTGRTRRTTVGGRRPETRDA